MATRRGARGARRSDPGARRFRIHGGRDNGSGTPPEAWAVDTGRPAWVSRGGPAPTPKLGPNSGTASELPIEVYGLRAVDAEREQCGVIGNRKVLDVAV